MSVHREGRSWQGDLIERQTSLSTITENGRTDTPGSPTVGDGWRELVESAVDRIAAALAAVPSGAARIVQIEEKFGYLRLYWHGTGLIDEVENAIDEVVALAEVRSAFTCEICGAEGRLYDRGRRLSTEAEATVEEAIDLAEARSAGTCETCGKVGRLFHNNGCYLHANGHPVAEKPGWENITILLVVGHSSKTVIVERRRYVRETDSFVDIDPLIIGERE